VGLHTALCDRLGIKYPILQSGMGRIAGPELVAEVSHAGGLGILAGLRLAADDLRAQIRRVRELTDRPFGVNLWLHEELQPPHLPSELSPDAVRSVQRVLNRFRDRLGVPHANEAPPPVPDVIADAIEVILEERVPVWSIGLGNPAPELVERCHEREIAVVAMIATVEDARAVADAGVDVVVAQGAEAGGHRSTWRKRASPSDAAIGTIALVPQVVDAVRQPVVAAGGIADGRGVVASLALGASGVMLGTRFVACRESMAPSMYKEALLRSGSGDTAITDAFTGLYARALRNTFAREYDASGAPVLPSLLQSSAADDVYRAASALGNAEYFPLWSGQSVGLVQHLPGAAEIVAAIVREAEETLARLVARGGDRDHGDDLTQGSQRRKIL
jgi:nitronate monooxygenase